MSQLGLSEPDLVQSICRECFYDFVKEFWETIIPEPPVWNWHIEYLCDELQVVAERVFRYQPKEYDVAINVPPGSTKSTLCSIMYPAWIWSRMPTARVISASYEHILALTFARRSRDIVQSEKWQHTFGRLQMKDDQNAKGFYENEKGGDRKAVGSEGQIMGSHGHFIIVDDPINPRVAVSETELQNINYWMDETLPSRKVDKAITPTILIMQRLHEDDPTGHLLKKNPQGVKHICLPCDDGWDVKPARLKLRYREQDGLLDPRRLSFDICSQMLRDLGELGYAGQMGQAPAPRGGGMFKVDRVHIDVPPIRSNFVRICRYWDKAATTAKENPGAAKTAGVLMGVDKQKRVWVLNVVRGMWDTGQRESIIKSVAGSDTPEILIGIEQEPGSGGKDSAKSTIANLAGYRVGANRPTGDKVLRADAFSIQVNAGNVYVPQGAAWWEDYRHEMQHFPNSTFKDQIDASSGAFSVITGRIKVGAL